MTRSSKIDDEIDRLMRDPNALNAEPPLTPQSDGRGHYDPAQARVPARDSRGGQWTAGGYRGNDPDRNAGSAPTPYGNAQLAQLGTGNPAGSSAQPTPFDGLFGGINAAQHLTSQNGFIQTNRDPHRNRRMQDFQAGVSRQYQRGRFQFLSTGPFAQDDIPGGTQRVLSSTTYAYDDATGAYATISATPARPMVVTESYGKLFVRPFHR